MREPLESHEDVARALRMLGQAAPPEGMEARIVGRLQQRQAELSERTGAGGNRLRLRWAFASAIAAAAIVAGLLSWHHGRAVTPVRVAVKAPHLEEPTVRLANVPVNAVRVRHRVRVVRARTLEAQVSAPSQNPPPLPLTRQEYLLLALAQTPKLAPAFITNSETVVDHGLGKNAILELDHQELKELTPLKTTLQLTQLKGTLPPPNLSGDIE